MFSKGGLSQLCLRIGLGVVFVWIGIDVFRNPTDWVSFVPSVGIDPNQLLKFGGVFDLVIGIALITGFFYRLAALLGALHVASVLIMFGVDQVLIRDVGLLGALLSLLFWKKNGYKKRSWYKKWFKRKNHSYEEY